MENLQEQILHQQVVANFLSQKEKTKILPRSWQAKVWRATPVCFARKKSGPVACTKNKKLTTRNF